MSKVNGEQVSDYLETSIGLMSGSDSVTVAEMLEAREVLEQRQAGRGVAAAVWTPLPGRRLVAAVAWPSPSGPHGVAAAAGPPRPGGRGVVATVRMPRCLAAFLLLAAGY